MDGNFFDIVLVKWDQAPFTEGSNTDLMMLHIIQEMQWQNQNHLDQNY